MAINNAFALRFSNEFIRPLADQLGRAYNFAIELDDAWTALGSSIATLTIHVNNFREVSRLIMQAYRFGLEVNTYWISGANTLFPNTTEIVADSGDGSTSDPNRPAITGAKVNTLMTRRTEFANWLETGLFAGGGSDAGAQRNEFVKAMFGVGLNLNAAGVTTANTLVTYLRQFRTNYEASSNTNLNTVLQVAVNSGAALL